MAGSSFLFPDNVALEIGKRQIVVINARTGRALPCKEVPGLFVR